METAWREGVRLDERLPAELFQRIKEIQIRTQRLVTDSLAGEWESAFKGRGMEFEQVREYQPGDDIRHIDWNVTARMGQPFIKEHREERELTVMLMVDVSSSGSFGSGTRLKQEVAAEVAAVLAYTAVASNDRVGLILFSDHVEVFIPPKKGRSHVWRVIREILTFQPGVRRGTDLGAALDYVSRVVPRRVVGFLISDFLDEGWEERLRSTARRHDLTAITVRDPRELELPRIGLIELEDAETGELRLVDTYDTRVLDRLRRSANEGRRQRHETFVACGVGELEVLADRPWIDDLIRFFRARERRGGRG